MCVIHTTLTSYFSQPQDAAFKEVHAYGLELLRKQNMDAGIYFRQ